MLRLILSILFVFSLVSVAENKFDKLIEQLGAPSYKERKKAEIALWELLPDSEDVLRKAAKSDDPEINIRARRVLEKYEKGILPGISEDVKRKIDDFWQVQKKSTFIRDWIYSSEFEDVPSIVTLMKLAERKGSPIYVTELTSHRNFFSTLYLKYHGTKYYEFFIRKYAEQGFEGTYLNWVKTNGLVDKEIAYYEAHKNAGSDSIKKIKYGLYKLAGKTAKAEALAKGDLKKELSALIRKQSFKEILENEKLIQSDKAIGEDKYKLLFMRLSGDTENYKLAKQVFIDEHGSKVYKTNHLNTLHALIANGEIDEAAEIAAKLEPLWYTRILKLKGDLKKVIEYGKKTADSRSAAYVAYELSLHYKKEECTKWLEKSNIADLNDRWLFYYTKAYVFAHGLENAFDLVIENINGIEANSRYQLYYALCPSFSSLASYLVGYKKDELRDNFTLLKKFVTKKIKGADLKNFYTKLSFNNGRISETKIRLVYDAALYLNDEEKLKSHLEDYLKYDRNKLREGKRLFLNEQYKEALKVLEDVKVKDTDLKLLLYLRARCYKGLGQKEDFEKVNELLKKSPGWGYGVNSEFIEFLNDIGDEKTASFFLDAFHYSDKITSSKNIEQLISHCLNKGDVDQAHFYAVKYYMNRSKNTIYLYPTFALRLYLNFLRVDFEKHLKNKDVDKALQTAERFLKIAPQFYDFHVNVVNSLKKSGNQKQAEVYFKKYMAHYEKKIEASPVNSTALNDWAWSAALCDLELDEAEKKARKAVELDSDNANIWDTLAEVLFRKGQSEEAVKAQEKACSLIAPDDYTSFRAKLSRFKGTLKK